MEFFQRDVREHTDGNGIFHVDAASDTARYVNLLDHGNIHIQIVQHRTDR